LVFMLKCLHMDSALPREKKYKEITFSSTGRKKEEPGSVLFYKGSKIRNFFTNDSGLYFIHSADDSSLKNKERDGFFDSLNYRADEIAERYKKIRGDRKDVLYIQFQILKRRLERKKDSIKRKKLSLFEEISIIRLWNTSLAAAVIFGMFSMTVIYKYLGQGVSAGDSLTSSISSEQIETVEDEWNKEKEERYMKEIADYLENSEIEKFNKNAEEMVEDYPIENMLKYILEKDKDVAAFMIAIAKKESNWGKRVPVLNGKDCYNYWGYREKRERMGTGGHTCFDSRKDAVDTVAKRIKTLIKEYKRDTPKEMVVWKCGSDCEATGGQAAANKWISDVDMYMKKLNSF